MSKILQRYWLFLPTPNKCSSRPPPWRFFRSHFGRQVSSIVVNPVSSHPQVRAPLSEGWALQRQLYAWRTWRWKMSGRMKTSQGKVLSFLFPTSKSFSCLIFHPLLFYSLMLLQETIREGWDARRVEKQRGRTPPRQIQQGAGVVLSVNGLRPRHVTQQQLPSINTTSPGKWWQDLLRDRHAGRSSKAGVVTAVDARRHSALDRMLLAGTPRNVRTQPIKSECA